MPQCAVITCGNNYRKASNVRYHRFPTENYIREHWKAICGRKDPTYNCQTARVCSLHFSRDNYEKDLEHELLGLPPRTRLRRGAYPDVDVPVVFPDLKKIMKQISGIKKKLNGKRAEEEANGLEQSPAKKGKKVLATKKAPGGGAKGGGLVGGGLNVNERPVRKKKKTKKYETYERDRKSPTPEIRQETNLLLALGLTPVKKSENDLNRMHIMEEENGKVSADAAQLPETPADLPKKSAPVVSVKPEETTTAGKLNGVCVKEEEDEEEEGGEEEEEDDEVAVEEEEEEEGGDEEEGAAAAATRTEDCSVVEESPVKKCEDDKEDVEIIKLPGTGKGGSQEGQSAASEDRSSEPQDLTVTCTSAFEISKTSQTEKHYPSNKVISISVEQCQTNHSSVNSIAGKDEDGSGSVMGDKAKRPKQVGNRKRSNKSTDSEESLVGKGSKKGKFPEQGDRVSEERERTVSEYVEKASGSSLEELQRNAEKLQQEIHSLSALARAKELEWNDIIRLKKVKEEMYLRLIRRKQVMLLSMGAAGRAPDASNWDFASENRMSEFFTSDEVSLTPSPKTTPRLPSNLTITKSQSNASQNLQRFLMQPQGSAESKAAAAVAAAAVAAASANHASLMMVPIVSSTPLSISSVTSSSTSPSPSSSSYLPRPQIATPLKIPIPDRDKLKGSRTAPIPILPKPNQPSSEHSPPIGRQGPIVDVKSIIADYRQNHPEQIPRRGRRLKGQQQQQQQQQGFAEGIVAAGRGVLSMSSLALGSGSQVRTIGSTSTADVSSYLVPQAQESSRPSSADSNRSASNATASDVVVAAAAAAAGNGGGVSFKDVLVQFAKMSQHQQSDRRNATPATKTQNAKAALYPEVTLHPVLPTGSQSPPNPSSSSSSSSSLLHGILTKSTAARSDSQATQRNSTFSPTLARLLTTPDRSSMSTTITTALRGGTGLGTSTTSTRTSAGPVSISDLLSTSKPAKAKEDAASMPSSAANASEDDPDDSADRLVIDESEDQQQQHAQQGEGNRGEEDDMDGEGVPECQGCHVKSAQFVCAGCGNQWYCSRNCQVTAWDEHSEVCSG